ncbi:hypothetical protein D9M70_592980 [compost metagenome]
MNARAAADSEWPRLVTIEMSRTTRGALSTFTTSTGFFSARANADGMIDAPMPAAVIHSAVDRKDTSFTTSSVTPASAAVPSISGRTP